MERKKINSTSDPNRSIVDRMTQGFGSITGAQVVDKLVLDHVEKHDPRPLQTATDSEEDEEGDERATDQSHPQQGKSHLQRLLQIQESSWSPSSKANLKSKNDESNLASSMNALEIIKNRERIARLEREDSMKENEDIGAKNRQAAKAQAAHARSLSRPKHFRPKTVRKTKPENEQPRLSRRKRTVAASLAKEDTDFTAETADSEVSNIDDDEGSTFYDESLFDILDQL